MTSNNQTKLSTLASNGVNVLSFSQMKKDYDNLNARVIKNKMPVYQTFESDQIYREVFEEFSVESQVPPGTLLNSVTPGSGLGFSNESALKISQSPDFANPGTNLHQSELQTPEGWINSQKKYNIDDTSQSKNSDNEDNKNIGQYLLDDGKFSIVRSDAVSQNELVGLITEIRNETTLPQEGTK